MLIFKIGCTKRDFNHLILNYFIVIKPTSRESKSVVSAKRRKKHLDALLF